MIVVIDNNIVLDALLEREPFNYDAEKVLMACAGDDIGCLTANNLTDIFYVLAKMIGAAQAKQSVGKLVELFEIISVNETDCINALEMDLDDFEDALLLVCAEKAGAEYIVSRDAELSGDESSVNVVSPAEFMMVE